MDGVDDEDDRADPPMMMDPADTAPEQGAARRAEQGSLFDGEGEAEAEPAPRAAEPPRRAAPSRRPRSRNRSRSRVPNRRRCKLPRRGRSR